MTHPFHPAQQMRLPCLPELGTTLTEEEEEEEAIVNVKEAIKDTNTTMEIATLTEMDPPSYTLNFETRTT